MNSTMDPEEKYIKFEIDNTKCQRRFHIAYEKDSPLCKEVQVHCPHCNISIFNEKNHPKCILLREENLVDSPDGSRKTVSECHFLTSEL